MDEKEERYIETMAMAGSILDIGIKIVNDYPDLPEEVMSYIKMMITIFEQAETVSTRPQTEAFINDLIEENM